MGEVVTFDPKTVVRGWVSKDLLFYIGGPTRNGPLASYRFHMLIVKEGVKIYEDALGEPDDYGQIIARDKDVDPHGGTIIVSGLYKGRFDTREGKVNPLISGHCTYQKMHGRQLTFNVYPIVIQIGNIRSLVTEGTTKSDGAVSMAQTANYAPGGVGGTTAVTVSKPGDQNTSSLQTGEVRNVTSVQGLEVIQVGAPRG